MKKSVNLLACATACSLALASFAVTPVAVWDRDFTTLTQGTYTLSENGNTREDGYLQVSGDNGILFTSTDALNVFTVIMRCEGLNLGAEKAQVLFTSYGPEAEKATGINDNITGVYLLTTNTTTKGIWFGADWSTESGATKNPVPANYTTLIYNHQQTNGTYAYALGPTSDTDDTVVRTTLYSVAGLRSSGTTYKGFAIGGLRGTTSTTLLPATGLKITSLAVFSGTLSEAEMKGYAFPSETQTINVDADTTVSAIKALFDATNYKVAKVVAADDVTITIDEAFGDKIASVSSTGTVTLSATTQPDASDFSSVDFSGVQGALLRSWLTADVVGVNFVKGYGNDVSGELVTSDNWVATTGKDGSSTELFNDGLTKVTWSSSNVYSYNSGDTEANSFLHGYLDDGNNKGHGVEVTIERVPYEIYDVVIYASTDTGSAHFQAKTVNGTTYTVDESGVVSEGNSVWGSSRLETPSYGQNAMRVKHLSGPLTVYGGLNTYSSNGARGGIAAIQIQAGQVSKARVGTAGTATQATWSALTWSNATTPTSGAVILTVNGDVELTIDETVDLSHVIIKGDGTITIKPDQANNVTFTAESVVTGIRLVLANDGVGITTLTGPVTYGYRTTSVESSGTEAYSNVYAGGCGAEDNHIAITHQGGSAVLDGTAGAGTTYYLIGSYNATETTVVFTNAMVNYSDCLGVGMAKYVVAGSSVVTTTPNSNNNQSFVLSQGGANRTAEFVLKDTAVVNANGTSDVDSNQTSIMFGHWNGPSTFTIQDNAAFNAVCQVLVGKTSNTQTINLNGGTFTAKGIKASAGATGTNTLNLNGGLAVLGETGITSYSTSTHLAVNVNEDSGVRASAATLPVTQPVTLGEGKTLSFTKTDDITAAVVSLSGSVTGEGFISVGAGVTLNLGTNRPADATFTVDGDGVLALVLADKTETPVLKVSAEPAHVTVYDTDGTTELGSKASVEYDAVAGTITIRLNTNTWEVQDDFSFDTAANWSRGLPVAGQELAIYATSDVTLTIAGTYTATSLLVYGGGNVTFAGAGSLTLDGLYLSGDTALNTGGKVSATTSIEVTAGSTLTVPGTGFSLADGGLTGAGTFVLDPGVGNTVTMSKSNTSFTGEAVIASGTVKMGDARSFGEFGRSASIRVKTGATLDANGVSNGGVYLTGNNKIILEEGATFTNSVGLGDTKGFAFHDIRAEGNATIDASTTHNGLARFYNYPTHIDLGANTLTKTGSDIFYLSAPTIDGTGTIDVTAGTLNLTCDYWGGTHPTFRNGTLIIRTGAALNLAPYSGNAYFVPNLTVNKIVLEDTGHISGTGTVAAAGGAEFRMINTNAMEYSTFLTDDTPVTVTGAGVFSFGTIRPTLSVVIGEEVGITVTMRHDAETLIELPLSRNPASVTVYDTDGNVDESASATYDAGTGILTIALEAITLEATSGTVSFDEPASWNIGRVPAEGEDVVLRATGDVTVSISHDYNLGDVTVSGGGSISFTGNGSVTTEHVYIVSDTTLGHGGQIKATNVNVEAGSVFVLDAGDGTLTETTVISGDGAVETYGNVTFDANNAFTGGLTVKPGSTARTTKQQGFGKNNYGQAIANLSRIVVEDGGSLDLKNTQNACYAITIAGKGVEEDGVYSGALFNSGAEMGVNTRQTASLTLTADALVKAEMSTNGWGIVNSGHAAALLALNGHTLTVSGKGYFPLVNVNTASGTTTTGTLVADGVTLGLPAVASDLSGVTVIALGGSKFTLGVAPKAISAVTIASTATEGVTVEGYANMTNVVPVVTTANINVFSLEVGATITNMTTDVALTAGENVTIVAGSRYTTTVSGQNVVTKVKALSEMTPFLHYDFNNGATDETGKASDSSAQLAFGGEAGSITQVSSRNSKAAWVHTGYTPWWNTNSADKSPLYAGEVTVATVAKFKETGIVLWGLGTTAAEAMGLVVGDDGTSVSAVARDASGSIVTLATLTDLENLTVGWHYVAVSANAHATMLYVDGTSVTSATGVSSAIGQQGQLGSFHGGVIGGDKVSEKGYYLDDWCVWDAALKATELRGLKTRYAPDPFVLHIR